MVDHVEEYKKIRPTYERFSERLSDLILTLLADSKIKIHAIENRTKDIDSFQQKILKPEKQYIDPLRQITDLCGIRVIVYYVDDLERVRELLEKEFTVDYDNSSDRGSLLKPNEFGYRSHHYIVNLSDNRSGLPEWHTFSNLKAEIQVRTVLQHAWAAISHALQYKNKEEVPTELARKLFRVSGLLELADEEFTGIKRRSVEISTNAATSLSAGNLEIALNGNSLEQYIDTSKTAEEITKLAIEAGFEFPEDEDYDSTEDAEDPLSGLAWACKHAGITSISKLDEICRQDLKSVSKFLKRLKEVDGGRWLGTKPWYVQLAVMFVCSDCFNVRMLVKNHWGKEIAEKVIKTIAVEKIA